MCTGRRTHEPTASQIWDAEAERADKHTGRTGSGYASTCPRAQAPGSACGSTAQRVRAPRALAGGLRLHPQVNRSRPPGSPFARLAARARDALLTTRRWRPRRSVLSCCEPCTLTLRRGRLRTDLPVWWHWQFLSLLCMMTPPMLKATGLRHCGYRWRWHLLSLLCMMAPSMLKVHGDRRHYCHAEPLSRMLILRRRSESPFRV